MAKAPQARGRSSAPKTATVTRHGSVHVSGEPGWEKLLDERIKKGSEVLVTWKNDEVLRAYCERVLNGDRKKLVGW